MQGFIKEGEILSPRPAEVVKKELVEKAKKDGAFVGVEGVMGKEVKYEEVREKVYKQLDKLMGEGAGERAKENFEKALNAAGRVYEFARDNRSGSQRGVMDEPVYHNMNHVEMVMTNAMLGFAVMKEAAKNFDDLSVEQRDMLNTRFGVSNLEQANERSLESLLVYEAFHEAGEWWPRMLPMKKLEDYRNLITDELKAMGRGDFELSDPKLKVRSIDENGKFGNLVVMGDKWEAIESGAIEKYGLDGDSRCGTYIEKDGQKYWIEVGFDLHSVEISDTNPFAKPKTGGEVSEAVCLGALAKLGDLGQILDKWYSSTSSIIDETGNQRDLANSSLLLDVEFGEFMPHASASTNGKDSGLGVSKGFAEVVHGNVMPLELMQLMDRFKPEGLAVGYEELFLRFLKKANVEPKKFGVK